MCTLGRCCTDVDSVFHCAASSFARLQLGIIQPLRVCVCVCVKLEATASGLFLVTISYIIHVMIQFLLTYRIDAFKSKQKVCQTQHRINIKHAAAKTLGTPAWTSIGNKRTAFQENSVCMRSVTLSANFRVFPAISASCPRVGTSLHHVMETGRFCRNSCFSFQLQNGLKLPDKPLRAQTWPDKLPDRLPDICFLGRPKIMRPSTRTFTRKVFSHWGQGGLANVGSINLGNIIEQPSKHPFG